MKRLWTIVYWIAATVLVAAVVCSLGYRFGEALFIGTMFLPGALAVKFFFPKIFSAEGGKDSRREQVQSAIFLTLGIIVAEILLFVIAQVVISNIRNGNEWYFSGTEMPDMLINPIFIAIMIAALAVGDWFFERWLESLYPEAPRPVTFLSDRKSVTLLREEILYVESNDSVTTVVATEGRRFRNRTPISQWEALLGEPFVRIHRSYLVNRTAVTDVDVDTVIVGDTELPVSRKYKNFSRSL